MTNLNWASRVVAAGTRSEDRVVCVDGSSGLLLIVADGAGGTGAGEVAAEAVIDTLGLNANEAFDPIEALAECDRSLFADGQGGETTAVVTTIVDGVIRGASVGDSGAWLIGTDNRDLTARQHRKPLLGSGRATPVGFQHQQTGTLLLASDGILKYVGRETIVRLAVSGTPEEAVEGVVDAGRLPTSGLQDDVAVVVAG